MPPYTGSWDTARFQPYQLGVASWCGCYVWDEERVGGSVFTSRLGWSVPGPSPCRGKWDIIGGSVWVRRPRQAGGWRVSVSVLSVAGSFSLSVTWLVGWLVGWPTAPTTPRRSADNWRRSPLIGRLGCFHNQRSTDPSSCDRGLVFSSIFDSHPPTTSKLHLAISQQLDVINRISVCIHWQAVRIGRQCAGRPEIISG